MYRALEDVAEFKKGDLVPDERAEVWKKMYLRPPVEKVAETPAPPSPKIEKKADEPEEPLVKKQKSYTELKKKR